MDDLCVPASAAPITLVQATVVRQFAGSRVERQLLSQVFDLVWSVRHHEASHDSSRDRGGNSLLIDADAIPTEAVLEGVAR